MNKTHPNAKAIAMRYIETMRESMRGQPAPDKYYAEKAAAHVGSTTGEVMKWIAGK